MSEGSPPRRRALSRASRWGGALLLALALGEALARHYIAGPLDILHRSSNPALVNELTPGHYISDGYFLRSPVVEYTVDERGCRVTPVTPGAPPSAGPPVLFLGSSIIFGIAVAARDALPEAARRELRERRPPLDITPLNCAVPGYSLLQTLRHAEVALDRLGARSLAVVIGPKHGMVPYDWTTLAPPSPALRWLTAHSRLARLGYLFHLVRRTQGFHGPPAPPAELRAALDGFAAAVRARGVRVVVFPIGTLEHPDFDVGAELVQRGLTTVPIQPPPHDRTHVHSDGDHWSPEGVRFIVRQMAPALAALVEDQGSTR